MLKKYKSTKVDKFNIRFEGKKFKNKAVGDFVLYRYIISKPGLLRKVRVSNYDFSDKRDALIMAKKFLKKQKLI